METRGARIARIRRERGFTQRTLASEIGVDPVSVSRWERDEATPRDLVRERLAAALGISVAGLEGYTSPSEDAAHLSGGES